MSEGTVFIVDDDEAVRESLSALLMSTGLNVIAFASAEAFLLGYTPVQVSCAIIDLRMPGMDGMTLLEHLRSKGVNLPVIVVTGHADVPLAVRAMKAGAVDFIEKPYTTAAMQDAVRRALDSARAGALGQIDQTDARNRVASLTARERDVLRLLVIGHPNKIIAFQLSISPRTVEIHRANVMKKLNAESLSHLVRMALAVGVGSDEGTASALGESP
ncbi:MAG: response regulator FixJ [Ferrovibrio sp.]|uniref:response regulator FixJ n=1 Tax=Ferrovibrio sp. TaxID=1917215 RepID=UPI00261A70C0|nr:response regulator FixJ [Ferrovibrio sp.]MCW0236456.1 response regulator FixJ [Ferrovibrio sp.]